jgi:TetR/AcrR family transcriptional repressor for divergent bdcA
VDLEGWTTAIHGFILGVATQARDGVPAGELHRAAEVLAAAWEAAFTPPSAGSSTQ